MACLDFRSIYLREMFAFFLEGGVLVEQAGSCSLPPTSNSGNSPVACVVDGAWLELMGWSMSGLVWLV